MVQGVLNTGGLGRVNVPVVKGGRGVKEGEFSYLNTHVLKKIKFVKLFLCVCKVMKRGTTASMGFPRKIMSNQFNFSVS